MFLSFANLKGDCSGSVTQHYDNCFYKETKICCYKLSYPIKNDCCCSYYEVGDSHQIIPCNTSSNFGSCWLSTTGYANVPCANVNRFASGDCTTNNYNFCNNCTSTGTYYTVWWICNDTNCTFLNISSSMLYMGTFPPTGITNTSLTSSSSHGSPSVTSLIGLTTISHDSPSLITGLLTIIKSKPSLIISTSPSTGVHLAKPSLTSPSTVAHQAIPSLTTLSTVAHANTIVLAGVIPTACILILGGYGLVVVVFVILYRRKSKQMSVNQRGRTEYAWHIININCTSYM